MATIGGIGGQGWMATQQLQRLTSTQSGTEATRQAQIQEAADKAGVDLSALTELRDKVRSAIEAALTENQGASRDDLARAVQEAVDRTLEENGVDVEELESQLSAIGQQMPRDGQAVQAMQGPPPGGPPPGGPPPGGPPPSGGVEGTGASESTDDEAAGAIATLADSDLSYEEILEQLLEAAEERAAQASDATTTETTDAVAATTETGAIQQLLDSDLSLDQILAQLTAARDQQADEQERISRLANIIASSLFGPAIDTYA